MQDSHLFITGMGRSGTTLLEKLLARHEQLSVLSQPFPLLYVEAKRQFLRGVESVVDRQLAEAHPLGGDSFPGYDLQAVTDYLRRQVFAADRVRDVFAKMADYDGQYHKLPDWGRRLAKLVDGTFPALFQQLTRCLAVSRSAAVQIWGAKETHCEEFIPALASQGVKCLLLIRDPRDVVASFNAGRGEQFGGWRRPTLFYARNWRKSVALAIELADSPHVHWLRYEDLAARPAETLQQITAFLDVPPLDAAVVRQPLQSQNGRPWTGNSSYGDQSQISTASIGRHHQMLPDSQRRYLECCCRPEMRYCGYEAPETPDWEACLRDFREPQPIERPDFPSDYSSQPQRVEEEISRLRLLRSGAAASQTPHYFLSPRVYQSLLEATPAS